MFRKSGRFLQTAVSLLIACFTGVLGTLLHQTKVQGEMPIGLIVSLGMVLMLSAFIRDNQKGRMPGFTFSISLAVFISFVSQNITGDILIPANNAGLWWSYGAICIAALVSLWPKLNT
jgi:N-acetyl-1-D-myo-inositol-2-amino-2-deoxy-alpha-D-glucopyranoside deacetylase